MKAKIYTAEEHQIQQTKIDSDALDVLRRLYEAGFTSYLVGGSVRDLLLGVPPKDFDISTEARPEQVRRLFSNCLLIGRRFRLAHIRFGSKIFEVSTFRSGDSVKESKLIVRDNEWGTPVEDVIRRDFTMNGLFYDPVEDVVIDYVGGVEDVKKKLIRSIGKPADRFKQDPVRMIRLLKFRARFGFKVHEADQAAMDICQHEILKSSQARILEETFKMLESGASVPFFVLMVDSGLLELLYPALDHFLRGKLGEDVYTHLAAADEIHKDSEEEQLDRSVLLTCLIYPILMREIEVQYFCHEKMPNLGEVYELSYTLLRGFVTTSFTHIPRKIKSTVNFIMDAQFRLTPLTNKRMNREKIVAHEDFHHSLSFLELRSKIDPSLEEEYKRWWDKFSDVVKERKARAMRPRKRQPSKCRSPRRKI